MLWVCLIVIYYTNLVNFGPTFPGKHKFSTAYISQRCCCRVTKFAIVKGLANWHLLPEFGQF